MKKLIASIIFLLSIGISLAQEITDRYCLDNTTLVTVYSSHWVINHRNYDINQTEYTHCDYGCVEKPDGAECAKPPIVKSAYTFIALAVLFVVMAIIIGVWWR